MSFCGTSEDVSQLNQMPCWEEKRFNWVAARAGGHWFRIATETLLQIQDASWLSDLGMTPWARGIGDISGQPWAQAEKDLLTDAWALLFHMASARPAVPAEATYFRL